MVVVVLAGCAGGSTGSSDALATHPVEVNDQLGGIRGTVVDEAIRPIANATVHMTNPARNTTTDSNGVFAFDLVPPGSRFLVASRLGYHATQSSVEVAAGQVVPSRIALVVDVSPVPYHVTLPFHGFIEFWGGIAQFGVELLVPGVGGLCNCYYHFTPDANLTTLVFEATWDYTTPDPTGAMDDQFYWSVGQEDQASDMLETGYCADPCRANISLAKYLAGSEVTAYLQGPDEYVTYEQPFDMYITLFYRGPPPKADWSFLKGDK